MKKSVTALLFFLALLFSTVLIGCEQAPNLNTEPTLSYIFISQKPAKLNYTYEEVLDLTGLVVKAAYSDNSEKVITGWSSSPKEGTKLTTLGSEIKITISYEEKETSFTVSVTKNANQKVLSSIYVSKKPYKLNYERDSQLDLTGIEIKGNYSDGTESVLENWTASPNEGTILSTSGTITVNINYENKNTSFTITVNKKNETSNEFFWGTWVRMDNGKEYNVFETSVTQENKEYKITSSNDSNLYVNELGSFSKQSDSVIICNNIPYFRKGGSNLEYTLKLVGFEDSIGRAASTQSTIGGKKVKGTSVKYPSFVSEAESDEDGTIRGLRAPVAGDVQTITITDNDNTIVVVTGIKVENNGDNMGTIPLSKNGQYSLKVTGTIPEEEKDDGYMYGNNYKRYPMTLTITNIGDVASATSSISITAKDNCLNINSLDNSNLKLIPVSTMEPGMTKTIRMEIECGSVYSSYIDTGINVTITNADTGKKWIDFVPLRFHRGLVPITVAGKSTEENNNATLNGFIIYPDGNNLFFSIPHNGYKTLFVPSFRSSQNYLLSFSGATVEGSLEKSTEMFYTVNPKSTQNITIPTYDNTDDFNECYRFGEPNNSEITAFTITENFTAYLHSRDIDFYTIDAESDKVILPSGIQLYKINYLDSKNSTLQTLSVQENYTITESELAYYTNLDGYSFEGWYIGGYKVNEGYEVNCNITLEAKWTLIEYEIEYELNEGNNDSDNPKTYTIESNIKLTEPTREGFSFSGWYDSKDFNGTSITEIPKGSFGNKKLYAKWEAITYNILYELNDGNLQKNNPNSYTIETDSIALESPTKTGYTFTGWYESADFNGNKIDTISKGSTGNKTLFAKWEATEYTITYELNKGTNNTGNPQKYTIESDEIELITPERAGYYFEGWFEEEDFSGLKITKIIKGSFGNRKLFAKWEILTYSIIYNLNDGYNDSNNPDTYKIDTDTITLQAATKKGYSFAGWYSNPSCTGNIIDKINKGSTGNKTLYAKWNPIWYSIDYRLNGGTNNNENPIEYTVESVIYLKEPSRNGYDFAGWYMNEDFSDEIVENIPTEKAENIILFAKWEPTIYSIEYYTNGGILDSNASTTYTINSQTIQLTTPNREGYSFKGWFYSSSFSGNSISQIGSGSYGNKKLYAKWQPIQYTITYNLDNGVNSTSNPYNYTIESSKIELSQPTRNGYDFLGWYTDSEKTIKNNIIEAGSSENKTFYAKWNIITYSLNYVLNGGSIETANPSSYTVIDNVVFNSPTKEGQVFAGWFESSSFEGDLLNELPCGSFGNKTLYAKWITGIKIDVDKDNINNLDLSTLSSEFELYVTGTLTDEKISLIANKLESATVTANLNLGDATATQFNARGNTSFSYNSYVYYSLFFPCKTLKKVILPKHLEEIDSFSFCGCNFIEEIIIPNSVTKLDSYVFYGCSNVKELNISGLQMFGPYAFTGCVDKVLGLRKYDVYLSEYNYSYGSNYDSYITLNESNYSRYESFFWGPGH